MAKATRTPLVSGEITNGQRLAVWLIHPAGDQPDHLSIEWPDRPTNVSTAKAPQTIADACRLLANASTELSRVKAGRKLRGW